MFGAYVENGPYIIKSNGTFVENEFSWNKKANMIWIDNPIGTGFSFTEDPDAYLQREKPLALDLLVGLNQFMEIHPEYSKQDFYIFGESYAGKYVPWLAATIVNATTNGTTNINLKGIGIGDGWVDPYWQARSYGPYLYMNKLINDSTLQLAEDLFEAYAKVLASGDYLKALELDNAMLNQTCVWGNVSNFFDIRYATDPTEAPYETMIAYLNTSEVQAYLHTYGISNFLKVMCPLMN